MLLKRTIANKGFLTTFEPSPLPFNNFPPTVEPLFHVFRTDNLQKRIETK